MSGPGRSAPELCAGDAVGHWVAGKLGGRYHAGASWAIGLRRGLFLCAGVIFENWNRRSITCHIAVNRAVEGAVTRRFLWAIGDYAFGQCGVEKVIGPVGSANTAAIEFDKRLGFIEEARIRDAHPDGDLVLLTVTRDTYRYRDDRYGQQVIRSAAD